MRERPALSVGGRGKGRPPLEREAARSYRCQASPRMAMLQTFWVGTPPRLCVSPSFAFFTALSSGTSL